ncbi:ABC transporter substrate-binding protein [Roseomonas sp. NAR14]|uniref:ABC transporter substrate-binding protein n=1 Tax=Roseomonas acroporae TaxID=2937791 RepID=A0A9X2BVV2_9PROT|nr:ABC transporter substrate-binding protein [Roseomonas acroporae]MCK8784394.1 ABC transporter substrate-binding protein [Roseomonas acroporae]
MTLASARPPSRRSLLRGLGLAGLALPTAGFAPRPAALDALLDNPPLCLTPASAPTPPAGPARKLKLAWNATAICVSPVALAQKRGLFAKHGLEVEFVNFGGSTEALLEAIATRKADAGVGMALRWLKPLEMGFDVKITAGTHGGCMRLIGNPAAGVTEDIESVRGKTIACADMADANKNFFAMLLKRRGIDPDRDVSWRVFPPHVFGLALERGEAQLVSAGDPIAWTLRRDRNLVEVATNLSGEWADRSCCILAVSGALARNERPVAAALTRALLEAQEIAAHDPAAPVEVFMEYAPAGTKREDLIAMLRSHTHGHHPAGHDLRQEIALYVEELKSVGVMRASTDPQRFADRVYADVLSA